MPIWWLRSLATVAALITALLFCADADARLEGALAGGAGERTSMPSSRSSDTIVVAGALEHMSGGQQSGSLGDLFNRPGLVGGFASGFLGAGVLGLVFGRGAIGGLGGVASYLGLIFQLALIAMLGRVIWVWWSGRNAPAFAGLSPRQLADPYLRSRHEPLPGGEAPAAASIVTADAAAVPNSETAAAHCDRD